MKKIIILTIVFAQFSFARGMDTSCSQNINVLNDLVVIVPGSINAFISERDFPKRNGSIGITAKVSGNGNTRTFSGNFLYEKVGDRLELVANNFMSIPTNANLNDFKEFFGPFPKITCVAR